MEQNKLLFTFLLASFSFFFPSYSSMQKDNDVYYLVAKGIYIKLPAGKRNIKVPYKEDEYIFFALENDSTASVKEEYNGKIKWTKKLQIASSYDTVYIKRSYTLNGLQKIRVEKTIYRKVY